MLVDQKHTLAPEDLKALSEKTDGYSGADVANLCREAALGPIRSIDFADIERIAVDQVREEILKIYPNSRILALKVILVNLTCTVFIKKLEFVFKHFGGFGY